MSICYDDSAKSGAIVPYDKIKATEGYIRHHANFMFLDFLARSTKDFKEAAQARAEIVIARRKMSFMEKHMNFEAAIAQRAVEKQIKEWQQDRKIA